MRVSGELVKEGEGMIRRTTLALIIALGIAPLNVNALGLGDIQLNSALNQYLDADIQLLSVSKDEMPDVRVTLASAEAFRRAGVERPFILTKLRFKPEARPDGSTIVHVSSRDPIREPFLNFLVEINWPKGKLVREYTVLLDPPVTLDRKPAPVQAPRAAVTRAPAPAPVSRPKPTSGSVVSGGDVAWAGGAEPATDEYGPTKRNDTLWGIAKSVRHDGASMQQAMISLFRANPQAFADNNINNLKVGQIIRVPKRDDMLATSRREAQQVYSEHLNAWQAGRAPVPAAEAPTPAAAEQAEPAAEQAAEAELKIATARPEGEGEAGPAEGAAPSEALDKLQQDLILAQEEKASALQEGDELKARVGDLESQLEDLERLLTLKSEQLARLQSAATTAPEVEAPVVAESAVEPQPEAAPAPAPAPVAEVKKPDPKPAPVAKQAKPATPKLTAKPRKEREKGFMEKVMGDPTMLGIGIAVVVVLLALIWVVISRRRSSSADFQESILVSTIDDTDSEVVDEAGGVDKQADDTSFLSDFSPSDIDALQDETGEVDPLAETDVYIAYGRYQQAEELITQAIEKDPERIELRHKLFEILFAVKDADKYVKFAEECKEEGIDDRDPAAWEKVVAMGAQLASGHELFADYDGEAPVVPAADETDSADEFELDLDDMTAELEVVGKADENASEEAGSDELEAQTDTDEDLSELDLDFDLDGDSEEADLSEEVSLDFDESEFSLELDGEETAGEDKAEESADDLEFDLGEIASEEKSEEDEELKIEDTLEQAQLDDLDLSDFEESSEASEETSDEGILSFSDDELSELESLDLGETEDAAGEGMLSLDDLEEELDVDQGEVPATEDAGDTDEVSTKLDLARAYIDMGDSEGAQGILEEVVSEGSDEQKQEAQQLLDQLS